jgi:peptidoglycan hydrolase-like protein with peptidoglycan-binding domain
MVFLEGGVCMSKIKKFTAIFLAVIMAVSILPVTNGMKEVEASGTAADLVSVAASQVGYHEKASNYNLDDFTANSGSANYNKYARDLGVTNGQAWCATFVWWCMKKAGVADSAYPSRTTVTRDWFNDRGLYHARGTYTPKAGDYVVFGNVSHCGIVEYVSGGYVHTIEGNSGDQVQQNRYPLTSTYILGYGEIVYSGSSVTTDTSNPGSPYPVPTSNIRSGSSGDQVRWVQKFANDVMGAGISIDGVAGTQTVNVIKQFQSQYGLTVDGIAGTQTINKMLTVWREKVAAATPVNLGTEFCALIIRKDIWKTIRNNADDVVLWDEVVRGDYLWRFVRQSDGSYMIESLYDKTVLDVQAAGTADKTNVITFKDGGRDNQRWYIYNSGNAYKLVPKHAPGMALDVYGAATANGSFVGIHTANGSVAQQFAIYKYDHQALKSISINTGYNKTMYIGDSQTLNHTLNPSNTKSNMVTWSTSNSAVATVDNNGVVKAVSAGKATIKCTSTYDSSIKATVEITVKKKEASTTETTTEKQTTEVTTEEQTTEITTEEQTTEVTTEEQTTEVTTEKQTTEAMTEEQTTEVTTEKRTTEATTEERTTEVTTEKRTTEATTEERTTEVTTEKRTTEATTEERTTEVTTEKRTTEATTEKQTTENTTESQTTEVTTERATTEYSVAEAVTESQKKQNKKVTMEQPAAESSSEDEDDFDDVMLDDDDSSQPESVGTIFIDSKNKCQLVVTSDSEQNPTVEYMGTTNKKAQNVKIPAYVEKDGIYYEVTRIADNAFWNNSRLVSVTIGENIEEIGKGAFENCKKLKSITIPKNVEKIGNNAFKDCKKLAKVTINSTVLTTIGKNAFRNCKALKKITIKTTVLSKIGSNAFKNVGKKLKIQVPKKKKNAYIKMIKKAGYKK